MIELTDEEPAVRIDLGPHHENYTWIAKNAVLERVNTLRGVRRGELSIRFCSDFWFVFNGQVFERMTHRRMAALVRPLLELCYYTKAVGRGAQSTFVPVDLNPTTHDVNETMAALEALPGVRSDLEPDQNTDELICASGRIDLRTGRVSPHSASVFATRMIPLELPGEQDEELSVARAAWSSYLEGLDLGAATLAYLRRAFGYAMTGRGCEKAFFFLHGEKNTSKTTLLRLVINVIGFTNGGGYAAETDCIDWLDRGPQNSTHTDSLMSIEGARLVFGDETPENARFNEARLKKAVSGGGATMRMSAKGEKGRDVPILFALFFSSNYLPYTGDNATQDRLKLVTHTKTVENPDPNFQARFMTPAMRQVVFRWLVDAASDYLANGMGQEPPSVILARQEYASDNDWFGTFLRERIGRKVNLWKGVEPLRASSIGSELARWAKQQGLRSVVSPNKLPKMVEARTGIKSRLLHGSRVFDGLALRFDNDGFPSEGVVDLELVEP